ncbi:uncharacterized protein LOC110680430 [Aedes aegypti]|uniref:Uncharacterized protein n=1 Tax=Aedes aegypti TaxID=7159 RepID=A0A903VDY8_AEDAE|nr:uncharacterized protein LOC110680430 [Aedes aegypti]
MKESVPAILTDKPSKDKVIPMHPLSQPIFRLFITPGKENKKLFVGESVPIRACESPAFCRCWPSSGRNILARRMSISRSWRNTAGFAIASSRDTIVYAANADSRRLKSVSRILVDVVLLMVLWPKLAIEEVIRARQGKRFNSSWKR